MIYLSFLLWLPVVLPMLGALALLAFARGREGAGVRGFAFVWSLLPLFYFVPAALVWLSSHGSCSQYQFSYDWLKDDDFGMSLVLDGVSWLFVALVSVLVPLVQSMRVGKGSGRPGYHGLILLLQGSLYGVFMARHFVPFFVFWEAALVPSFLLIRMWGGAGAPRAAMRFFVITLAGGVMMLAGFLLLQIAVGSMDFDTLALWSHHGSLIARIHEAHPGWDAAAVLTGAAVLVWFGIGVKIPIVPLHAWLPDAYTEAPTPVTILLTGLLSKMGVYALVRVFLPIFGEVGETLAPWLLWLAVATVLLGALAAYGQKDLKRMLAYSSVNHLGYCVLGVAAVMANRSNATAVNFAVSGVIIQAVSHGLISAALFIGIGVLEDRSGGMRGLGDFGGLRSNMPVLSGLMMFSLFASLGLPGMAGFIGEWFIFTGAIGLVPLQALCCLPALLLTAIFLLRAYRRVFTGPLAAQMAAWSDIGAVSRWQYLPLVLLIAGCGLLPQAFMYFINPCLQTILGTWK